jgi:tryptophan synthase alpha chain
MSEKRGRYADLFSRLRGYGDGAFIPFVMLGDPARGACLDALRAIADSGADALELGIPFSDPVADGPVIQAAANRAIDAGATPSACFEIIGEIRRQYSGLPIGLLVYANLAVSRGIDAFYRRAAESGADSVLIADAPVAASPVFAPSARRHGIDTVYVAPPNADDGKLREIARACGGYTYFLGRAGVTGADREMRAPDARAVRILKDAGAPPIVAGFGISRPEHVRMALAAGLDGAISGSATVAIIAANRGDMKRTRDELASFVKMMKSAAVSRLEAAGG